MRVPCIAGVAIILFLASGVATQTSANWAKRARDAMEAMRAKIVKAKSPTELVVKVKDEEVSLWLEDIEPMPLGEGVEQREIVQQLNQYIRGLTNQEFIVAFKTGEQGKDGRRYGTLWDSGFNRTLQEMMVADGYAMPSKDADRALWLAYERAKRERKGLWVLSEAAKGKHNKPDAGDGK